jgi:heat shock protein HtpX
MESPRISFYNEIKRNKRNSFLLISVVLLILLALVYAISAVVSREYTFIILIIGTIVSLLYVVISYYKSADIAIKSVGAKKASKSQFPMYHSLVEGIALASGLPKPKLYVMEEKQINAFASGRDPKNAVICMTTGALAKLDKQELEGVIAHEMSHIANYDIRFMTLTAVLVGLISIISQIFLRSLWYGGGSGGGKDKSKVIFLIIAIVLAILSPILVALVQLAISRKREYAADSTAVKFMRTPTGLQSALKKIQHNSEPQKKVPDAVSSLFLAKPSKSKEWFMTHPPLSKRIAKLDRM